MSPEPQTEQTPPQPQPKPQIGGRRCHINALRHEDSGQFYAMSREDRQAFNQHYLGITGDLNPQTNRERWLATSIAEDQWRLNRARAIENNIFAIGMSGPIADSTHGDSPEVTAAACQARIWLQDGRQLQLLALFEQRIRRSVEKNEKQLKELQAERQAAFNQAVEEAILLGQLDLDEREAASPAISEEPPDHGPTAPFSQQGSALILSPEMDGNPQLPLGQTPAMDGELGNYSVNGTPGSAPLCQQGSALILSPEMGGSPQLPLGQSPEMVGDHLNYSVNGFAFSFAEINQRAHRELRLRKARQLQKAAPPFQLPKAA